MATPIEIIDSIRFTSIEETGTQFRAADVAISDLAPIMSAALAVSETRALRLTKGIFETAPTKDRFREEADALLVWAREGGGTPRQTLASAYRQNYGAAGNLYMVHQISTLPKADARAFMSDYFASGGDMRGVAEWLGFAGSVLRRNRAKAGTAGFIGDAVEAVGEFLGDVGDAIVEGVGAVLDAIVDAGRSIAELASEILQWTVSQVGDLIEALIEAGQSLAEILSEALAAGTEALVKFARAAIDIGRTIGDVLVWATSQAVDAVRTVVGAIIDTVADVANALAWAAGRAVATMGELLDALLDIGRSIGSVIAAALDAAADVLEATVRGFLAIGRVVGDLVIAVINRPSGVLDALVQAFTDIGQVVGDILGSVVTAAAGVLEAVVGAVRRIGQRVIDVVAWMANEAASIAQRVLETLLSVGERLIDIMALVTQLSIAAVRQLVGAAFAIGRTLTNLMHELFELTVEALGRILSAALELGRNVAEFVGAFVGFTYRSAVKLARAAFEAGLTVAELVVEVAAASYFVFRKVVNAILDAAGPVGDLMQFVLDRAEGVASDLWRRTLLAIRFSGDFVFDALDWAIDQGEAAFEAVLRAWESIDQTLVSAYQWIADNALRLGDEVFASLGRVTARIENSNDYILNFLENDLVEGARLYAQGLLQGGYTVIALMADLANQSVEMIIAVTRGMIDAGATIGDLVVATLRRPDRLIDNVLQALDDLGRNSADVLREVEAIGEEAVDAVVRAWRRAQVAGNLILDAAWEVGGGAFGLAVSSLLNLLATYRPLSAVERDDAEFVFGNSIDLDRVFMSREDVANEIIFWVQDSINRNQNSRAFVTTNLINFDVDDAIEIDDDGTLGLDRATFIHELTHVWQAQTEGPLYLSQAIHAQITSDAYDYGNRANGGNITIDIDAKTPPTRETSDFIGTVIGDGGQTQLAAANADLFQFSVEAQAEIISHWFVRSRLNPASTGGADLSATDWDPFIATVRQSA